MKENITSVSIYTTEVANYNLNPVIKVEYAKN